MRVRATLYFAGYPLLPRNAGLKVMSKAVLSCCLALAFAFSASAMAADGGKGDPQAGKSLVYTCGGCHGVTGYKNAYPNYHVPRIAGQNYDYIVSALTEYKKGERSHPTMRAQGESLSDADIRNIAAYLSSLSPSK
jgi:cytochrome c553